MSPPPLHSISIQSISKQSFQGGLVWYQSHLGSVLGNILFVNLYIFLFLSYIYIYIYIYIYKKRRKKVHQTTNTKILSMHTLRQQQNAFQQKLKLNIESHGKPCRKWSKNYLKTKNGTMSIKYIWQQKLKLNIDKAWWFLSLKVFRLLSSSLFPRHFARYVLNGLLQVFVKLGNLHETSNFRRNVLYWIHRGHSMFWLLWK